MRKLKPWAYIFIFLITTLACGAPMTLRTMAEKGELSFTTPEDGAKYTEPADGNLHYVEVYIYSTFDTPKDARLTINGMGPVPCRLEANQNNFCQLVPMQAGQNTLIVEVFKLDGKTVVSAQRAFYWQPYSPVDRFIGDIAIKLGGETSEPAIVYGLIGGVGILIASFFFLKSGKYGVLLAVFLPLIALAVYSQQTGSYVVTLVVLKGFFGVIFGVFILLAIRNGQNKTHKFNLVRPDGARLNYKGPGGQSGADVIHAIGTHADKLLPPPSQSQPYLPDAGIQITRIPPKGIVGLLDAVIHPNKEDV